MHWYVVIYIDKKQHQYYDVHVKKAFIYRNTDHQS